ncbi:translocase of chloroplast 90, chloroplastic [Macadamia integrifolia]|uniref:translocase of chloroplast 90, chloroplastic n=1 Tax=Macadamia integrifolia TaxID=60698 RepID=UPI001C50151F|nr:translocase of chloroplast 90, chloroplastic [Macadamia integrifolia]XP_042508281.1 translocase of chloroplast 90, chloroplastic [Macadamia integrifolia]
MIGDSFFKIQSRMKGMKNWTSQLISKSLLLSRPPSCDESLVVEEHLDEDFDGRGSTSTASLSAPSVSTDASPHPSSVNEVAEIPSLQQHGEVEDSFQSHNSMGGRKLDPLANIEALQIKFLRLCRRLALSSDNLMVGQVLYRLHVATLIRAGESDLKRASRTSDTARAIAAEQEATGQPDLDFNFRILVLGKTGVGKSATINSIFDQAKAMTNAFQPATDCIQEVSGIVNGMKVTFIDTPGFFPSSRSNVRRNRKIMFSVKRFIRKSPPDVVLYFERLDLINMGYSDFPLLKLITDVFGPAIWFNTILVMTHASSALPEGPNGYPVSYDSFVAQCTNLVQHYIHQAVSDSRLDNPVLLVENHPQCRTNILGEKVLPDGQVWRSQFLLLCICTKVLGDANTLLKFQNDIEIGLIGSTRLPSLPHLLSSLLRAHSVNSTVGMDEGMEEILDTEDEDEYDQLPPIRILTKSQFERLTKTQKDDYLDELDYRETLYLKKQWKAEIRRRRESMLSKDGSSVNDDNFDPQETSSEAVLLPDMAITPSFDSDSPVHRYRCLVTSEQLLVRPVLDPNGWDHDVGFDGINLETAVGIRKNVQASVLGQVSKDKQDFSIQTEGAVAYKDPKGHTVDAGLDIQTAGKELVCTIRGDTKLRNLKHNMTGCGFSMTSFRNKFYLGAKLEDTVAVGNRVKFVLNAGRVGGLGQVAYGGSFEATLRGGDYPVRNDKVSLSLSVLSFDREIVLGGIIQSDFRIGRSTKISVNANLNSRNMGQICIKTSCSEQVGIPLIAVFSIIRHLLRRRVTDELRSS